MYIHVISSFCSYISCYIYSNPVETSIVCCIRVQQELVDSSGEPLDHLLDQLVSPCFPTIFCATLSPAATGSLLALWLLCSLLTQCCHTVNHLLYASRFFTSIKYEKHKQTERKQRDKSNWQRGTGCSNCGIAALDFYAVPA